MDPVIPVQLHLPRQEQNQPNDGKHGEERGNATHAIVSSKG